VFGTQFGVSIELTPRFYAELDVEGVEDTDGFQCPKSEAKNVKELVRECT
jgi:hypothetical protein